RAFGDELGLLFQIVDDILDGDGYVLAHGPDGARRLADEAAARARAALADVPADTSVLEDIVDGLATRTSGARRPPARSWPSAAAKAESASRPSRSPSRSRCADGGGTSVCSMRTSTGPTSRRC